MGVEMEAGFVCVGARERSRSLHACMVCHSLTVGTIDISLAMQLDPLPLSLLQCSVFFVEFSMVMGRGEWFLLATLHEV